MLPLIRYVSPFVSTIGHTPYFTDKSNDFLQSYPGMIDELLRALGRSRYVHTSDDSVRADVAAIRGFAISFLTTRSVALEDSSDFFLRMITELSSLRSQFPKNSETQAQPDGCRNGRHSGSASYQAMLRCIF